MSSPLPRRPSIRRWFWTGAAVLGFVWAALGLIGASPLVAQEPWDEPAAAEAGDATVGGGEAFGAPAVPANPVVRRREMTETLWYMFFVTAGVLFALVAIVWGLGWYKRAFLEEDELQAELFDAATRAEIERHRKQVQAEQEAAKRAAETETTGADRDTLPDRSPSGAAESPRDTLAEQTAAPPDPAVQRDADAR
ncbi:G protein-coupled receptor family protein [Alienimonas californiensis]|uniref:Uncharacterized protein n=1 Tax=Alienimonas californiensis TaxID=2527989 RepID=A0A517P831_9PLAN|nr:hypothetical protein [Alienimonas californiensis]QDT15536.1 hypothetical protein CA12_16210 [Alienimonas californiensis]